MGVEIPEWFVKVFMKMFQNILKYKYLTEHKNKISNTNFLY